jgi:hypothetical protein
MYYDLGSDPGEHNNLFPAKLDGGWMFALFLPCQFALPGGLTVTNEGGPLLGLWCPNRSRQKGARLDPTRSSRQV